MSKRVPLFERFSSKINFTDTCWLWKACTGKDGYGKFKYKKEMQKAHRFSWEYFNGEIPDGLYVLHKCDVKKCVNPDHLFLGTHTDNMRDMIRKGKKPSFPGEKNGNSKLKRTDVAEIMRLFENGTTQIAISKKFGVHRNQIYYIVHNKLWSAEARTLKFKEE